jgi:hypothetical protein
MHVDQPERFNSETVTHPKEDHVISFVALGQKFTVTLKVPHYISDKLTAEDWDFAEKLIRDRAEDLRRQAATVGNIFLPGTAQQIEHHVCEFAKTAVYNQFMKYQVRAGNHEGHEVPTGSLQ